MSTKKKLFLSAAGAAGGAGLDVDEVFSTYLYDGTGSAQTITNGIDLDGEGGLVWIKNRENQFQDHSLFDTTRSPSYVLYSNTTSASSLSASRFSSFNTNGFTVGTDTSTNESGKDIVSWTFRKASNFFDVVTYTGNGTAGRTVAHNLGSVPGMIILKNISSGSEGWRVYHRGANGGTNPEQYYGMIQANNAFAAASTVWNNTAPTSSVFTVGSDTGSNNNGDSFVAYLFAHNNSDGDFGPDGNQDIIKCGSYTGLGGGGNVDINLGFEPQWIMIKNTSSGSTDWAMFDSMRGIVSAGNDILLRANLANAEFTTNEYIDLTPTGFKTSTTTNTFVNTSGDNYIYMAIRRGPLAEPTSATDVFAMDDRSGGPPNAVSGFPVDMGLHTNLTSNDNRYINARLIQGKRLFANLTSVEGSSSEAAFDYMTGFIDRSDTSTDNIHYMWKRAPSFFDVVTYTGNGTASRQITHNLGATPQWVMVKPRSLVGNWINWFAPFGDDHYFTLTQYGRTDTAVFFNTADSTSFTLGTGGSMNNSGENYIVFLFGSLSGISKVGTYTGNGTNQNIDCGFSSGARFVLIRQDIDSVSTSDWFIYDTFRGLVAGNDKRLELNTTDLQDTDTDSIDPYSAGFNVVQESEANLNVSGQTYVFYAIA